jgi:hypothetical protein
VAFSLGVGRGFFEVDGRTGSRFAEEVYGGGTEEDDGTDWKSVEALAILV